MNWKKYLGVGLGQEYANNEACANFVDHIALEQWSLLFHSLVGKGCKKNLTALECNGIRLNIADQGVSGFAQEFVMD